MSEEYVLVSLSPIDQSGVDTSSITLGYILDTTSYDVKKLDAAAERLVEKWRLLAGRLEYNNETELWCIRVPTGKLDGIKTHKFTHNTSSEPLDVPLTHVKPTCVETLSRPALKYFRHTSTLSSLSAFSAQKAPIMSIHVSTLTNCTCVGISFPHGVFDATGMGQVVAGLDSELNGKPWVCPNLSSENILSRKLMELPTTDLTEEPAALENTKRACHPINFTTAIRFILSLGWEFLWHRVETKGIYLGEKVIDMIVREAKEQLREESCGKKFVSTGDILLAWFLKASQGNEIANNNPVFVSSAISIRPLLSPSNPAFATYTHNAIMICAMPPLTTSFVHNSSITQLATLHRSFLDTVRTPAFVHSYSRWMSSRENNGRVLPIRAGAHSWMFSNQVVAGLSSINFGVEQAMFWVWTVPITLDHACFLNMFEGGYILEASARKTQWIAIEREVERLREEVSGM